jgi:hypothetical protein
MRGSSGRATPPCPGGGWIGTWEVWTQKKSAGPQDRRYHTLYRSKGESRANGEDASFFRFWVVSTYSWHYHGRIARHQRKRPAANRGGPSTYSYGRWGIRTPTLWVQTNRGVSGRRRHPVFMRLLRQLACVTVSHQRRILAQSGHSRRPIRPPALRPGKRQHVLSRTCAPEEGSEGVFGMTTGGATVLPEQLRWRDPGKLTALDQSAFYGPSRPFGSAVVPATPSQKPTRPTIQPKSFSNSSLRSSSKCRATSPRIPASVPTRSSLCAGIVT